MVVEIQDLAFSMFLVELYPKKKNQYLFENFENFKHFLIQVVIEFF